MTKKIPIRYIAAGGVVLDPGGANVLLLIRPSRDEVRLPKGHIEEQEAPEEAALREVIEETGYGDIEILTDLGQQLIAFQLSRTQMIQRTEHYYLMQARSRRQVERPKADAEQFFTIWVTWDEAL